LIRIGKRCQFNQTEDISEHHGKYSGKIWD
jgi:hypothetical protein